MVGLVTCKNKEEPIKMKAIEWSQVFLDNKLWELSVAMETRVLIQSSTIPNADNP